MKMWVGRVSANFSREEKLSRFPAIESKSFDLLVSSSTKSHYIFRRIARGEYECDINMSTMPLRISVSVCNLFDVVCM